MTENLRQMRQIEEETAAAVSELLDAHPVEKGRIFVIGCSSSEIAGGRIGTESDAETGRAVFRGAYRVLKKRGVYLAAQCCEHLNRALVIESECRERYTLEPVCVVPWLKGGGAFATAAYEGLSRPVVVEHVRAAAGLDIGGTLIGMHLNEVAVPFRPEHNRVGRALVAAAYTRPKLIGGERARYE